jgi:hypothetical protein
VNAAALSGNASTLAMTKTRCMMVLSYVGGCGPAWMRR